MYSRFDPQVSPSVLADMPACLRTVVENTMERRLDQGHRKTVLVSSNSLANRFIMEKWDIRPSQRKRYRDLFAAIRNETRSLFRYYLMKRKFEWKNAHSRCTFGVYEFNEIRGNLILAFVEGEPRQRTLNPILSHPAREIGSGDEGVGPATV